MTFLQAQDAITVSTLPHPISMFFLGVSFIISFQTNYERVRFGNRTGVKYKFQTTGYY